MLSQNMPNALSRRGRGAVERIQLRPGIHILVDETIAEFPCHANVFDGACLRPWGCLGESHRLRNGLNAFLAHHKDNRPLIIRNFLERLDEAVDLRPIFEALNATGRQVFIAVPRDYQIHTLEEMPYDIHTL